jgi:hypothetical protein
MSQALLSCKYPNARDAGFPVARANSIELVELVRTKKWPDRTLYD